MHMPTIWDLVEGEVTVGKERRFKKWRAFYIPFNNRTVRFSDEEKQKFVVSQRS